MAGLKRLGWTGAMLAVRRKGDPRKVELAQELRRKTTMPMVWIAGRLCMGSRGYLAWLLSHPHENTTGNKSGQSLIAL